MRDYENLNDIELLEELERLTELHINGNFQSEEIDKINLIMTERALNSVIIWESLLMDLK